MDYNGKPLGLKWYKKSILAYGHTNKVDGCYAPWGRWLYKLYDRFLSACGYFHDNRALTIKPSICKKFVKNMIASNSK